MSLRRSAVLLSVVVLLGLTACGQKPLPVGPQEISGTLERVPLSLSRRGTHVLRDPDGDELYYAESTVVNLGALEKQDVTLLGIVEANTDRRAMHVLVVQRVVKGGDTTLKRWELTGLSASIDVPAFWEGALTTGRATFREPGKAAPVLTITTGSSAQLPFDFKTFSTRSGSTLRVTPEVIGLKRAASVLDQTKLSWTLYVDLSTSPTATSTRVLSLGFTLDPNQETTPQTQKFLRLARTLKITEKPRSVPSSAPSSASASAGSAASVSPVTRGCGGPAGILCPAGYYCAITDATISAGVCRKR